jgi:hypothetical protein
MYILLNFSPIQSFGFCNRFMINCFRRFSQTAKKMLKWKKTFCNVIELAFLDIFRQFATSLNKHLSKSVSIFCSLNFLQSFIELLFFLVLKLFLSQCLYFSISVQKYCILSRLYIPTILTTCNPDGIVNRVFCFWGGFNVHCALPSGHFITLFESSQQYLY